MRGAKRRVTSAKEALRVHADNLHVLLASKATNAAIASTEARLQRDLDAAVEAHEAAEAAQADALERWQIAGSLASRGRAYAGELRVLPADHSR